MVVAWWIADTRTSPLLGGDIPHYPRQNIEMNLIIGSIIFGVGWGLSGLCPSPAIASVAFGGTEGIVFLAAMVVGMAVAPRFKIRFANLRRLAWS